MENSMPDSAPAPLIESRIYLIRGHKVLLDADLALLYQVETRALNQAVRRNEERFPEDFMFRLSKEEEESLRSQTVTSNEGRGGRRYLPYAFTEQGIAMLSSVLTSKRAIEVNIPSCAPLSACGSCWPRMRRSPAGWTIWSGGRASRDSRFSWSSTPFST